MSSPRTDGLGLTTIRQCVANRAPVHIATDTDDAIWAATALIVLDDGDGAPAVLFIERATRAGDPWSGHMALPGGRREPDDADLDATARRETFEEVGVALPEPIGRLPDHRGRTRSGRVATFVFALDRRPVVTPEPAEVADAVWIPVSRLASNEAAGRHLGFPAIHHERFTIWGMTHRTVKTFLSLLVP